MPELTRIRELQQERMAHVKRMRAILAAADHKKRSQTAEETQEYERLDAAQLVAKAKIKQLQGLFEAEREMGEIETRGFDPRRTRGGDVERGEESETERRYYRAFDSYLRRGIGHMDGD